MDGLTYYNSGVCRFQVQQKRTAISHHGYELFISYPCGIKEYIITQMTYFIYNLFCIVNASVIISQLYGCKSYRTFFFSFFTSRSLIRLLMYSSLKQCSSIPPIEPKGFLAVSRYMGIAPACINAPKLTDL